MIFPMPERFGDCRDREIQECCMTVISLPEMLRKVVG